MFGYNTNIAQCVSEVRALMKKFRVIRVDSSDGEIHFILEEFLHIERSEKLKDSDLAEIKRISRKEAPKPLRLFREE
jgi:hypothetical protein